MKKIGMVSVVVAASIFCCASLSVEAKGDAPASKASSPETKGVARGSCQEIIVNAKPEAVYNAILKMRDDSQDTVKELSRKANRCVLEEKFPGLPVVGDAKCVYEEVYTPFSRIEYSMVRSDRFKAFEGRWLIVPTEDGNSTRLSLSSYVDVDIPVPFAKQICKLQTSHGVKERLHEVKSTCEKNQLAQSKSRSVVQ
ncbi:MAG: hypothetical protein JSS83_19740 [Cyanobacteria bacterium SZAS LIN-3]|nr:hypothetical protein [Cyanobacteria bacterium SZAS LIN-3]